MRKGWIFAASMLALAACGRGGSGTRITGPNNVTVSGAPGDITVSTPNGTAEIHAGGGPLTGLPDGIPAYPNADASQTIDINGGSAQGHGRVLGFSTHDSPAQVIGFYAQAVAAAGYTVANQMTMAQTASVTAQRGQDAVSIVASEAGGSTRVQIIVGTNTH